MKYAALENAITQWDHASLETRKSAVEKYTSFSLDLTKDKVTNQKHLDTLLDVCGFKYLPSQDDFKLPIGGF